ncbi:Gfo/Idh/MocA family oxidoreductase [Paenarthrobacter sp. MSM-2-10-13]|uniref:Gfo/Idh/MocA family protein n=1 Tax=Micrococcaceae TaxID=1268 RepID=UPI0014221D9D|nr:MULTISPECIES: Gfo/Idh/MocA family oxidoreductase [Micrococcaceae]NHW46723.1 Gfo/Idh/MocA family oxidoreductase [Paenarthrobacter sp. MSM-2-10-13]BCW61541.1 dehydrogenase [Arthrobacter sp. StoSoilB22]
MPTAAVIGCGDISTIHFAALATMDNAELVAVCDTDPDRLQAAEAAHGVPGYADYLDMLQKVRPDVVHVCTPHHLHASVAADCLERGVNVIVEKPLAHTLAEGQRLIEVAERSEAKIAVCFQNRYNATSQAMHELLDGGTLGQVIGASATVMWHRDASYYRNRPWRGTWAEGGGGLMMNQAIHTVDLLQWLVGDVAKVEGHASTRSLGGVIEVEDTAEFVAEHVNGARSVFYSTLANAVNAPVTLDIVTEKATLSLRGDLTVSYADGTVDVIPERVAESGGRSYWGVSHELLIADFYNKLQDAGPFWINPAEAGKSLRIIKDIYAQSYPEMADRVG